MSDAVQIALIGSIPAVITSVGVILTAVLGFTNRKAIQDVHHELNSMLTERVQAATDSGRVQERSEQRAADIQAQAEKDITR